MVEVSIPESNKFTVCGDIHGQFYDLINIFRLNGVPSQDNPYVSIATGVTNSEMGIYKSVTCYLDDSDSYSMVTLSTEAPSQ